MRIIVTGGCGFIGSHLVDRLISENHDVLVIDALFYPESEENLNKSAELMKIDIRDKNLEKVFMNFRPEVVYHLAAQIDVQTSLNNPYLDAEINILGSINVLQACKNSGVTKIIYSSSAAIYGENYDLPIKEVSPSIPISFYGISKFTPEYYIKMFSDSCDLDYSILRYSNVYGERQVTHGEGGVVSIFIDNFLRGIPSKIFGDGSQTRDFIYVKDVVDANMQVMTKGNNQIFNISTNTPISINDLYYKLASIADSSLEPVYCDSRMGDITHSYMDNSKILEDLNWKPSSTIDEGLRITYSNFEIAKIVS
ncbi:NAD-dependent epimerase/dehydratase family protein [Paenibacillus tundrae]